MPQAASIRRMFAGVAPCYDLLNRLLSLGIDRRWRRRVASTLTLGPDSRVLDLCCGTGDLALEIAAQAPANARCWACDFTWEMLVRARRKTVGSGTRIALAAADALELPFGDGSFGVATVAFGIRNLEDMRAGLRELRRVLEPGGELVILEFSHPNHPLLRAPYRLYLHGLLPLVGRLVSRREGAYRYLADSITGFPDPESLCNILKQEGFSNARYERWSGGIVAIHRALAEPEHTGLRSP